VTATAAAARSGGAPALCGPAHQIRQPSERVVEPVQYLPRDPPNGSEFSAQPRVGMPSESYDHLDVQADASLLPWRGAV
jgi:hypothetical protein